MSWHGTPLVQISQDLYDVKLNAHGLLDDVAIARLRLQEDPSKVLTALEQASGRAEALARDVRKLTKCVAAYLLEEGLLENGGKT